MRECCACMVKGNWLDKSVLVVLPRWSRTFVNNNIGWVLEDLNKKNARIFLYCGETEEDKYFSEFISHGIILPDRRKDSVLENLFNIIKVLSKDKYDIVLWTYSGYRENLILALNKMFRKTPYVIKTDSSNPIKPKTIKSYLSNFLFTSIPLKYADLILVESDFIYSQWQDARWNDRLYLFPNCVPVSLFATYEKKFASMEQTTHARKPYILFTGRIAKEKGIDLLIDAFYIASKHFPSWVLNIVGPVWESDYLKECCRQIMQHGLNDRVFFHPFAIRDELFKWYYYADIYVLPSRKEGLANRITEAMYFRNPIVAFDVGQTKSMVSSSTGFVVPTGNVKAFSEAIIQLMESVHLRQEMGDMAHKVIIEQYNYDILIPKLLEKCEIIME